MGTVAGTPVHYLADSQVELTRGRAWVKAEAWCLLIHADPPLSLTDAGTPWVA
jgi:hypothetical protein